MNLSEIHENPELLAQFLNVPFEPGETVQVQQYGYGYHQRSREIVPQSAAERVAKAWGDYRAQLAREWSKSTLNPYKPQTWGNFLRECLREGLGLKGAGKLADKLEFARMTFPALYTTHGT